MAGRFRGRRIALLIASALPLVAKDNEFVGNDSVPLSAIKLDDNDIVEASSLRPGMVSCSTTVETLTDLSLEWDDTSRSPDGSSPGLLVCDPFENTTRHNASKRGKRNSSKSFSEVDTSPTEFSGESEEKLSPAVMNESEAKEEASIEVGGENHVDSTSLSTEENVTALVATEQIDQQLVDTTLDDSLESPSNGTVVVVEGNTTSEESEKGDPGSVESVVIDYASKSAGALILEKSASFQGTSNLLIGDNDKYAIIPCSEEPKVVVIGLSEEILVKQVAIANFERYSSRVREFKVLGSTTMGNWIDLGIYEAAQRTGRQAFELREPSWARYLQFRFLTHFGDEYYCTISQISVHGSTMLQGFHEQWEEESVQVDLNENIMGENDVEISSTDDDSRVDDGDTAEVDAASTGGENCITALNAVCLRDIDFGSPMFLVGPSNESEFDRLSVLASASICRSSSHIATPPSSRSGVVQELHQRAIATPSHRQGDSRLVANPSEEESVGTSGPYPIVEPIGSLVKAASVIDIDLHKLGSVASVQEASQGDWSAGSTKSTTGDLQNPLDSSHQSVHSKIKSSEDEALNTIGELEDMGLALAEALRRLPDAACLKRINFDDFKAAVAASRTGVAPGSAAPGSSMEPIFKKLADEIKTLQASIAVHDRFARETASCYQRVVLGLMAEMAEDRFEQDARLSALEQKLERRYDWSRLASRAVSFLPPVAWFSTVPFGEGVLASGAGLVATVALFIVTLRMLISFLKRPGMAVL